MPTECANSALRVRQRFARQVELSLEEAVQDQTGVLLVTTERVAVGHLAELPHALPANLRQRVVRVEVPGAARRRDRAALWGVRRARVDLARRGVGLELDLRIPGPGQGRRLLLQDRRRERPGLQRVGEVGP